MHSHDTTHVDSMQRIHKADKTYISDTPAFNDALLTDVILPSNQFAVLVKVCDKAETHDNKSHVQAANSPAKSP
jgi:hypothetical protein